jgi:fructokinase
MCSLGTGPDNVYASARVETEAPENTLKAVADFFSAAQAEHGRMLALGIASFGPVNPIPGTENYGYITDTPKTEWRNTDLVGRIKSRFPVPIGFDTDVNGAALGEARWGAGVGLSNVLYLTVGTGVGGGATVRGRVLHGMMHPEMGHIRPIRSPEEREVFAGICPFHGDCLEGLASGPAIEKRWGKPASELDQDHPAWDLEADYLAQALSTYIYVLSPQRIILGGGVMQREHLFPGIRKNLQEYVAGYIRVPELEDGIDDYVTPPGLGTRSGIAGAFALAERALDL